MKKMTEVTGKGARRSLCLTPEKSSLRESVVCVEEQPESVKLLQNPEVLRFNMHILRCLNPMLVNLEHIRRLLNMGN